MFTRAHLVSLTLGSFCLIATPVTANITDLVVLSDKSAKITAAKNWRCSPNISITAETADASFFEVRLNDLGMMYGAALSQLSSRCPSLSQVTVYGKTASVEVIKGHSKKSDGWVLRLEQSSLTKEALRISDRIKTFDDLEKMLSIFAPFRSVPGIAKTSGYTLFAQASQNAVQSLLNNPTHFDTFIQDATLGLEQEEQKKKIEAALGIIQLYAPQAAQNLRARAPQIQNAVLKSAALRVLEQATNRNTAISAVVSDMHNHLSSKTPDTTTLAEIDAKLAEWVEERIAQHEAKNDGYYLDSAQAHIEFVKSVGTSQIQVLLPETNTAMDTASFWFEALSEETLAENLAEAQSLIETSGNTYQEIDLILETGLALHDEFLKYGFKTEADDLLELARARIEGAISDGLDTYRRQMLAENMTLERVAYYKQDADLFFDLSQDYPGFSDYVEAIEEGVKLGQLQACAVVASNIENPENQSISVLVGEQSLSLKPLACSLYVNGHLLTDVSFARDGASGSISLLENNENELVFEIAASGEGRTFWGSSETWDDEMSSLITPPPNGKPDRNGVTECDLLAGDPNDQALRTDGIVLEDVSLDYDFDRAVEACIAAVEYDPSETRQVYQLARILEFLGDTKAAAHYAEVAAARKYAPAIHLQAFSILTYREDDNAYFDAIDLLKVSAKLGYGPSKTELKELLPEGQELYRPLPPPTDREMINTAFKPKTHNFVGAKVHVSARSIKRKSCFQTSEKEFSCELIVAYRCEHERVDRTDRFGGNQDTIFDLIGRAVANPQKIKNECATLSSQTQFIKFTKTSSGWGSKKEF
ncbi:MAG: hypothetical protein AB8B48_18960 [Pseudomonadales bacterium]